MENLPEVYRWIYYPAIIAAGFMAGFINTLAGSGSLITLPLLIFLGLPANIANGTNRVAILLQNVVAVSSFHKEKRLDFKRGLLLAISAVPGALIGAWIAVDLDAETMRNVIGWLMVVMLMVILVNPKKWMIENPVTSENRLSLKSFLIFFGIGIYGGFIQAGVGIFLLAGLVLGSGLDLVRANAVKLLIVLCFTVFALSLFVYHGQVVWSVGLVLAIGNMSGAWVATKMAVKRGVGFVRGVLVLVVIMAAVFLLGLPEFVGNLF